MKWSTCPHCGAPASVDMIEVSTGLEVRYVPSLATCSAHCWELDPEGYLEAVKRAGNTP